MAPAVGLRGTATSRCVRSGCGDWSMQAAVDEEQKQALNTKEMKGVVVETTKGVVEPTRTYVAPAPLQLQDGDALEAKWDKLRGGTKRASLRRSLALQRFFIQGATAGAVK